jgi:hypothetical protein
MAEEYIRSRNRQLGRFTKPLRSSLPSTIRGLVNELGFRLFATSVSEQTPVLRLPEHAVRRCIEEALVYVMGQHATAGHPGLTPTSREVIEAQLVGERLDSFFQKAEQRSISTFPVFPGCGWLDECVGDALAGGVLFEVKAGDRNFRTIDLRQVMVYCALNFGSRSYHIERICLVNPRVGVFLEESLDDLCSELSGRPTADVLADIVQFVSEPPDAYMG